MGGRWMNAWRRCMPTLAAKGKPSGRLRLSWKQNEPLSQLRHNRCRPQGRRFRTHRAAGSGSRGYVAARFDAPGHGDWPNIIRQMLEPNSLRTWRLATVSFRRSRAAQALERHLAAKKPSLVDKQKRARSGKPDRANPHWCAAVALGGIIRLAGRTSLWSQSALRLQARRKAAPGGARLPTSPRPASRPHYRQYW